MAAQGNDRKLLAATKQCCESATFIGGSIFGSQRTRADSGQIGSAPALGSESFDRPQNRLRLRSRSKIGGSRRYFLRHFLT